jgi:hypothetical protein
MEKTYWEIFFLSLIGCILFIGLLVLMLVFAKKVFFETKYGLIKLSALSILCLFVIALSSVNFVRCCKDYYYVANDSYEEDKAKVMEFTYSKKDYDGNGQIINAKPKFWLIDHNESIVLYAKNVEIGKTYLIRYYPNTKICEVVQEVP